MAYVGQHYRPLPLHELSLSLRLLPPLPLTLLLTPASLQTPLMFLLANVELRQAYSGVELEEERMGGRSYLHFIVIVRFGSRRRRERFILRIYI